MRLLLGFIGVCALLAGVLVWHLAGSRTPVPPLPAAAPHEAAPVDVAPAPRVPAPAAPTTCTAVATPAEPMAASAPAPVAPASAPVQWPAESAADATRLARAQVALQADPYDETALRDVLAAAAALQQWPTVADSLARLVDLRPDDVDTRFEHAAVLLQLRRFLSAADELQIVVAQRPDDVRAWSNLATAHQGLGRLTAAGAAWTRVIELAPTPDNYARRAEVLLDQHDWSAAAADLALVLQADPEAGDVVLNLALALERSGDESAARDRLRAYLDRHPRHVPVLNRLVMLARTGCAAHTPDAAGACAELVELCRRSLEIDANQPVIQGVLSWALETPAPTPAARE